MRIAVCIATYRRPAELALLLDDLVLQRLVPAEVIVVDNTPEGTARSVVEDRRRRGAPFALHYDIQPVQNISLTRNRTVELAQEDWIAFIDDDERPSEAWLSELAGAASHFNADGVLGPILPVLPATAPAWIQRGHFYDWVRMPSGATVPLNELRFGNVLLRASLLRTGSPPFDPAYGLTGGEDGDLLTFLAQRGARIVWCDAAVVDAPVEASRLKLGWLMRRALRGGQDYARHSFVGRYGPATRFRRSRLFVRSLVQMLVAAGLVPLTWPLGTHLAAFYLLKVCSNFGKLSTFWGWHHREYERSSTPRCSSI